MTIKVTVNVVSAEQFDLQIERPAEDQQLQLPAMPAPLPSNGVVQGRQVALELSPLEEAVPLSYGVPHETGVVTI